MKNYLTLVIGLVIVATPAFASRARLEALGESKNGSYYINDSRNMFYNPAFINDFKRKLMLEFGTASVSQDSTAAPKAEGGFTNTFGDFAYGLYLGHESDTTSAAYAAFNSAVAAGGLGTSFIAPDNAIDFFFGGDAGVKWGFNLMYASANNKISNGGTTANANISQSATQLIARLGILAGNLNAYADVGIMTKSKGDLSGASATRPADELNGKIGLNLGAAYALDSWTPFVNMFMSGFEYKPNGTKSFEANTMSVEVGAGYKKDVTKNTNLFSKVEVGYETNTTKTVATSAETTAKEWNLPITIGAETQALSWLAFRGSVSQSALGQLLNANGSRTSIAESTSVAAGVGLTFGDLSIDGLVATNGSANSTTIGQVANNTSSSTAGTKANAGLGDNMISRIGLTYNF